MAQQARRQPRAGKNDRKRVLGRFDHEAGVWLVPVSDTWLDMLTGDWSPPVQLRAVASDDGKSYAFKVRTPTDAIDRLVHVLALDAHKWRELRGPAAEHEIRDSVERALRGIR